MTFGKTLQRIRRAKGLTQRQIATKIGMDCGYFSRLENDKIDSTPTRETIDKIADGLTCTEEERSELFAAAGRIDKDLENATRRAETGQHQTIGRLFSSIAKLSPEQMEKIMKKVESELKANPPAKPEKK